MKKVISILMVLCLMLTGFQVFGFAENPPKMPPDGMGSPPDELPPAGMGQPPEGMALPDGMGGGPGGMPGSHSSFSGEYKALVEISEDTVLTDSVYSEGTDEVGVLVTGGTVSASDVTIFRNSNNSTGGDNSSFYGVGSAVLATGGNFTINNAVIETDAAGGAGVFSYGDGIVTVSDSVITTHQGTSGGIHVAGGGTLYAENLTVTTNGASSAAIRSDRGSGTMVVDGGTYTSNGSGSPAVYVTADITISDADLTATGSEALCLEGLNSVQLSNCTLTGDMPDLEQNDNTWTVILYQSMSGDSEIGQGSFRMEGGKLVSHNGGLFYTTNTESIFTLQNVEIESSEDCEYFLRCTGNANQRGWGKTGSNGADCTFTAISQQMTGNIVWDSISNLNLSLTEGSVLTGTVLDDESCAGEGGSGSCRITIDESSAWIVTGNSTVTELICIGTVSDADGNTVSIIRSDGTVLVQGDSPFTVTTNGYIVT